MWPKILFGFSSFIALILPHHVHLSTSVAQAKSPSSANIIVLPQTSVKPEQTGIKTAAVYISPSKVDPAYINGLVSSDINQLLAEGLLKGQKGDKGDPGSSVEVGLATSTPDGIAAPAPIVYNSNIPGNIAGFTELSGGDVTAQTSLTVDSGAPLEVDGPANFTSGITANDLNVATIESPVSGANFDGYSWTDASSRDLKENFATVTPADVLAKIASLPIYTWNYKTQNPSIVHMGPVAEDFYADFNLGDSSSSISTIDPAGVALAGIQALGQKINSLLGLSGILDGIKNLGVEIDQGIIKVESLVADSITTGQMEVGSGSQPTGITIYDTVTGQPVCISSANNILQEQPGKCQVDASAAVAPTPNPVPAIAVTATSTPEVLPTVIPTPTGVPTQAPSDALTTTPSPSGSPAPAPPPAGVSTTTQNSLAN